MGRVWVSSGEQCPDKGDTVRPSDDWEGFEKGRSRFWRLRQFWANQDEYARAAITWVPGISLIVVGNWLKLVALIVLGALCFVPELLGLFPGIGKAFRRVWTRLRGQRPDPQ
jgi:hypothetical protein